MENPATNASTLSDSASFVASEATCWGSVEWVSTMKSTGWPLMPPLSLTHLKYAAAALEPSVKSMPGIFVVIEPSLIGVPVAFLLASASPAAHFVVEAVAPPASLAVPPPPPPDELESLPPQPTATSASAATTSASKPSDLVHPLTAPSSDRPLMTATHGLRPAITRSSALPSPLRGPRE